MPIWAAILIAVASSSALSTWVAWFLSRRQNEEITNKAHADAIHSIDDAVAEARAQTKQWFDQWKEEAEARGADRIAFIAKIEELERVGLENKLEIINLKAILARWEKQLRDNGLVPLNGKPSER